MLALNEIGWERL